MRFRTKTIFGIALIEGVLLAVLGLSVLGQLQSSNEAEIERRINITARLLDASVRDALIAYDLATVESVVKEFVDTGDLAYVRIYDRDNRLNVQRGAAPVREFVADSTVWQVTDGVYDREVVLQIAGQRFGSIQFGIDVTPLHAVMAKTRNWVLSISLLEMALVAVFSFILGTYLTRQLLLLRDASQTVAKGDLSRELVVTGRDELAETVTAFNQMVTTLRAEVAERNRAEEQLHIAASVFIHAREGAMITAPDGTIIDVNGAFTRITGYRRDEVIGQNPRILSSGRQEKEHYAAMWHELKTHGHWYGEVWNRRKNGEVFAEMQTISAVRDPQGNIVRYVALFSDITALKDHQFELERIAHYDALTALPNRVLLADRLRQAMAQAQRRGQQQPARGNLLAVAYLDLDGFKAVNDTHGHATGDQLLIALATRMTEALREGDTLARIGGDEFVAVLLNLDDVASSVPLITRLLNAAAQSVGVGSLTIQVSASIGVTFYPQAEGSDADQLLRQADLAMYQAKVSGKNRYHIFDAEQDSSVRGHHESLEHIRHALKHGEFVLHYQPKVNMRTGAVIGAEALIRWQHPEMGLLAPGMFLPVIEDHALSIEVGEWVIEQALTQMDRWQEAGLDLPVSVNVGARQLQQADFVARLQALLAAHLNCQPGCNPSCKPGHLTLEVLETSALEDVFHVSAVIEACRKIGVTFALDDFGTGYASLTYLKRLGATLLKIDQSFVRDMLDDTGDLAILEGVLGLATAFRREVIAEGVESMEQGEMLLQLGCELAQGYAIARPMPADAMPGWVAAWRPYPAWSGLAALNRNDFPLLFASAEHRAWVGGIEKYIKGEDENLPPLDHQQCRFGLWLIEDAPARFGDHPVFPQITSRHREIHTLAATLLDLNAAGRSDEALSRLTELHGQRDVLLGHLKALAHGG